MELMQVSLKFSACLAFCWYVSKIWKFNKYVSKKWLKDGAKILMDRESDVVVTRGDETGRWGRLNISARQKCKKKASRQPFEQSIREGKAGGTEGSGKGVSHWGWCVCKKRVDP